jgi:hypothetical protein
VGDTTGAGVTTIPGVTWLISSSSPRGRGTSQAEMKKSTIRLSGTAYFSFIILSPGNPLFSSRQGLLLVKTPPQFYSIET